MKYPFLALILILCSELAIAQQTLYRYFDKKWGVTNEKKQIVIAPEYDEVELDLYPYIKLKKGGKIGLADLKGKLFIPFEYNEIEILDYKVAQVNDAEGNKVMSLPSGKLSPVFKEITGAFQGKTPLVIVRNASPYYGIYDPVNEKMVLNYQYSYPEFLWDTATPLLSIYSQEGKFGLVNGLTGKEILPMAFDDIIERWENGKPVIITSADETVAYYDTKGEPLKVKNPDLLTLWPEGDPEGRTGGVKEPRQLIRFESTGPDKWNIWRDGFPGNKIALRGFSSLTPLGSGKLWLLAKQQDKVGILDCNGKIRLPVIYDSISPVKCEWGHYPNMFYTVTQNGLQGLVNGADLKPMTKPIFSDIIIKDENVGIALPDGKRVGIYNICELRIVMAEVTMPDGKKGFMNLSTGKVYIPGVE